MLKSLMSHLIALAILPAMAHRTRQFHNAFDGHFEHVLSGTDILMSCQVCSIIEPPTS